MTWSLIARDTSGAFGVAIASRFFAVGALSPRAASGVGALATQALMNPLYAHQALEAMARHVDPVEIVRSLTAADPGRDLRQLHLIDSAGRIAAHTGAACIGWCGHRAGNDFSVAGNMLAGPRVLDDTAAAFADNPALPFALRLITAMAAGEAAGGDKRGKQSAALLIHSTEAYPQLSLRVDDHAEPLAELRRLYEKAHERFIPFMACGPSKARPWGLLERQAIEDEVARHVRARSAT
jgi:uncharacterized Ntn-hydrolase superfamily protein